MYNSSNIKQDTTIIVIQLDASMDSFQEIDLDRDKPPR